MSYEDEMSRKTVQLNKKNIQKLPNDKPVVYKILDSEGENIYTGIASRGNVHNRLVDHLPGSQDEFPGAAKVHIQQVSSIDEAKKKESNIISRSKPKHNQRGK